MPTVARNVPKQTRKPPAPSSAPSSEDRSDTKAAVTVTRSRYATSSSIVEAWRVMVVVGASAPRPKVLNSITKIDRVFVRPPGTIGQAPIGLNMSSETKMGEKDEAARAFTEYLRAAGLEEKLHQFEAVRWCARRERVGAHAGTRRCHGGLVADEMGLGKTIEVIGTMAANPLPSTLIVVPVSLLAQWKTALQRGGVYEPLVYHGPARHDIEQADIAASEVVLTTYGMVAGGSRQRTTAAGSPDPLAKQVWDRVVCDEAHHLRNRRTIAHKAVCRLRAKIRWLLTGTPIQNRKSDFYSLCAAMGIPDTYYLRPENLGPLARAFILKRTKTGVGLHLPPLTRELREVAWENPHEERLAEDIHALLNFSGVAERAGDARRRIPGATSAAAFGRTSLPLLVRARQACVHPGLMGEHLERLQQAGLIERQDWLKSATQDSSKIAAVLGELVGRKENGARKLVFCHYKGEIDAILAGLKAAGVRAAGLDGRTPARVRQQLLTPAAPEDQVDVLVLQIQTGCEGLNLQCFSEVFFVSPHWNPAVEDQAVARCHRMGQTKPVAVFRFLMEGFDVDAETQSVENYTRAVQGYKRELVTELEQARAQPPPKRGVQDLPC